MNNSDRSVQKNRRESGPENPRPGKEPVASDRVGNTGLTDARNCLYVAAMLSYAMNRRAAHDNFHESRNIAVH
ncbi:hypothetical protein ACTHQ2_25440, partial [Bacillus subtilis]|uniref:hypothetical protein n=1 Tax=Bacillus subtilis TaxID=1423 RepID=UPI003F7C1A54